MEYPSYLIHYGIQGQKWGVRRFQNEDGTYTEEGLKRRKNYKDPIVNKYSADYFRNNKYDPKESIQIRKDFNDAYNRNGPGKNIEKVNSYNKKVSDKAHKIVDEEFLQSGKKKDITTIDDYIDRVYTIFDRIREEDGADIFDTDIAHLKDLGYSDKDAKDIAKWMDNSFVWGYIWDEKTQSYINPKNKKN
jgi:hypothetical protein